MLNKRYIEYSNAVAQQLNNEGFVLLTDFLTEEITADNGNHQFRANKYSYSEAEMSQQTINTIHKYAEELGLEINETLTRSFSSGDFTLQDTEEPYEGFEIVYMHAPNWQTHFRGEITYTPVDAQPIIVPVTHNGLAIIRRENEMRSFVKKVTHYAQEHNLTIVFARCK